MADDRRVQFVYFLLQSFAIVSLVCGQAYDGHAQGGVQQAGNFPVGGDQNRLPNAGIPNLNKPGLRPDVPQNVQNLQNLMQRNPVNGEAAQNDLHENIKVGRDSLDKARELLKAGVDGVRKPGFGPKALGVGRPAIRLAEDPACREDVQYFCSDTRTNNFQIIDCLQSTWDEHSKRDVSVPCQHMLWSYKMNLTLDLRFDNAASQVCKADLEKLAECSDEAPGTGKRIACMIEHKENISSPSCIQFVKKMASIVFSDYRLICDFATQCQTDIDKLQCGRLNKEVEGVPHQQGRVISCLSENVGKLEEGCKKEILHVAELQSDDFHQDRALFYACKNERDRLCGNEKAGGGAIYKCLYKHKFDKTMSAECRHQLTRRQVMMQEDVKVNRALFQACRAAVKENRCFHLEGMPKLDEARQSTVLLCLEEAMKLGKKVEPECVAQLKEIRRSLLEDYKINPELVKNCHDEIHNGCGGGLERGGQTIHCLMDLARKRNQQDGMSVECRRALDDVLLQADVGDSVNVDPVLKKACGTFMASACSQFVKDNEGGMMNCLMERVGTKEIPEECEERVMEIQFFVARDFSLDSRLMKYCKDEAVSLCSARLGYRGNPGDDQSPERGPHTFACLYRHRENPQPELQLSRPCAHEVQRVLRQRALSVELNPRIQDPCLTDLSYYCTDKTKLGEELLCLQDNYEDLEPACRMAVANFTQDQDKDYHMDKLIMRACTPMIKQFCAALIESSDTQPGDVMECLIQHKTDAGMNGKCRAGIEHHQLVSLKDYKFSYKFKEACKQDVLKICPHGIKSKADVVTCLSASVRNDTLHDARQRVSGECRNQLTFELLQRSESVKLDPRLEEACGYDVRELCGNVSPGGGAVLDCLRKNDDQLSKDCKKLIFVKEEEESVNVKGDYVLFRQCKSMIKQYCADRQAGKVFKCLREHKGEEDFDHSCKKVIVERMRERSNDVRLNVNLMAACKLDMNKFCKDEMEEIGKAEKIKEGKVMGCLRKYFTQKRLSESCEQHVAGKIKESNLDYKQDVLLARFCKEQIREFCLDKVVAQDLDDHGQVEECLKEQLAKNQIHDPKCLIQIARVLAESKADVHVDPILYRTCAMDIKHFCEGVPRGEGRQMSCLLSGLTKGKNQLTADCRKMLEERKDMWEHAAKAAPAENFNDLAGVLIESPSRNYFMSVIFIFVGMLFMCGICCGRVSKRIRRDAKNR